MSTILPLALALYLLGVFFGLVSTAGGAFSDSMRQTPRTTLRNAARRAGYALTWPVSLPLYLVAAVRRDQW